MANCSELGYRPVEIEVKSAKLTAESEGSFYLRISVSKEQGVRTKATILNCSSKDNYKRSWDQRFVFSVPRKFISDENFTVSFTFTLFKSRKYMPDLAVGQFSCDLETMFPVDKCMEAAEGGRRRAHMIMNKDKDDDDHDHDHDHHHHQYYDQKHPEPEIQEKETFELKASVDITILKGESEVGTLGVTWRAWKKYYPHQLNLHGGLEKSYPIIKGSSKLGKLTMRKASPASASSSYFSSYLGNVENLKNLAMEVEDFEMMMQRSSEIIEKKQQPKRSTVLCFAY